MRNDFYNRFKQYVAQKQLFQAGDKILLAVSGGIDSVVMLSLFQRAGFHFGVAHCNFQLRGAESHGDEAFVRELATACGAPFHSIRFDTEAYMLSKGLSVQMAARELRYQWFDKLIQEHGYRYLATAHHQDDLAETILLNLTKGAVLEGLHGILPKNGHIIRPLLWAGKDEIQEYAAYKELNHREDASNSTTKYQRNKIRHQVIPLLKEINPDAAATISQAAERRQQLEAWMLAQAEKLKNRLVKPHEKGWRINITAMQAEEVPPQMFFTWVQALGFTYTQIVELYENLPGTEHKTFYTAEYTLLKDKGFIAIFPSEKNTGTKELMINTLPAEVACMEQIISLSMADQIPGTEELKISNVAWLNADKLQFPLALRRWQPGDSFRPFGMRGKKLISDYLTDLKLSYAEKDKQLVLLSGGKICWVVGRRIDDAYKIGAGSGTIIKAVCSVIS